MSPSDGKRYDVFCFFFNDTATTEIYTLSLHDALPIWLGKAISILVFLGLAEVVAVPAFALFFRPVSGTMIAGIVLADLGIAAVGTLLAAMAAASRARELLLPLLFLPLALPIVVG